MIVLVRMQMGRDWTGWDFLPWNEGGLQVTIEIHKIMKDIDGWIVIILNGEGVLFFFT